MKPFIAFFMEYQTEHWTLESAMEWIDEQSERFGMRGDEAECKGYAQIFTN